MSLAENVFNGLKDTFFVGENLKRLANNVDRLEREVRAQDRRLVRVETIVELATGRGPPHLPER